MEIKTVHCYSPKREYLGLFNERVKKKYNWKMIELLNGGFSPNHIILLEKR